MSEKNDQSEGRALLRQSLEHAYSELEANKRLLNEALRQNRAAQEAIDSVMEALRSRSFDKVILGPKAREENETERERKRIRSLPKSPHRDFLCPLVASAFDVSEFAILGSRKLKAHSRARSALIVAMRGFGMNFQEIAYALNMDHTTCVHHVQYHHDRMKKDRTYEKGVRSLKNMIETSVEIGTKPMTEKLSSPINRRCDQCDVIFKCSYVDITSCPDCRKVPKGIKHIDQREG